jgi:NAD(P)-dependent dehydrogenase (short-subunit alcohol dehydrogenase family)
MDLQLVGRRALVTGGSRGIGKAVAAALLAEGATVAITARGRDALERTVAELDALAVVADTGDDDSVRALVAKVTQTMGGVDILVNAAATPGGQSRPPVLAEITAAAFWADVNVKVLGYLQCAQAVAPGMVERGWGRIINVSGLAARSTGSMIGSIRDVAVAAMTKNVADELGPSGVNVTVVHPGTTRTEATAGIFAGLATAQGVDTAFRPDDDHRQDGQRRRGRQGHHIPGIAAQRGNQSTVSRSRAVAAHLAASTTDHPADTVAAVRRTRRTT